MPSAERIRSTWRRSAGSAVPSRRRRIAIVSPATVTTPSSGVSRRLMQRRNVLLPEPEEPRIETTSPSFAVSEMPLRTSSAPKRLRIPTTVRAGVSAAMGLFPLAGARAQMRRKSPLEPQERGADRIVDGKVDRAGEDERQIGDQRVVADLERDAEDIPERDQRNQRRGLHHRDRLRRIGGQRMAERDRKDDAAENEQIRHPAGAGGLDLTVRHREQRAAENLRLIGGGAERQRQDRAVEGVAQERPEDAGANRRQRRQAIIDDEKLDQERRAAEHGDIGPSEYLERLRA